MVIEINIKIADSDGKVLYQFENQFDETESLLNTQSTIRSADNDFEDFFSKYLSLSGFALRKRLISDSYTPSKEQDDTDVSVYKAIIDDDNASFRLDGSELEYKIRIGKNRILIGKIPLKLQPADSQTVTIVTDNEVDTVPNKINKVIDSSVTPVPSSNRINKAKYQAVSYNRKKMKLRDKTIDTNRRKPGNPTGIKKAPLKHQEAIMDTILNYTMVKAIEKYEANLYPASVEEDCDLLEP